MVTTMHRCSIALMCAMTIGCNAILENEAPFFQNDDSGESDAGRDGSRDAAADLSAYDARSTADTIETIEGSSGSDRFDSGPTSDATNEQSVGADVIADNSIDKLDSSTSSDVSVDASGPKDAPIVDNVIVDNRTGGAGGTTGSGGAAGTAGSGGGGAGGAGGATGGAGGSGGAAGNGGAGGSMPESGADTGECTQYSQFTLGIHIILDVTWAGSTATNSGTGKVHLWNKATFNASGTVLSGEAMSCGTTLPDIILNAAGALVTGKSKVQIQVPLEAWDAASNPRFGQTGTLAGWTVGSDIAIDPAVGLVGLTMTDPMGAWPASFVDITGVDAEGDGNLGITALGKQDATYTYPPTALGILGSAALADKVYLATRTSVQLTGKTTSCEEQSGMVTTQFFDNHVIGCHIFNGGECTKNGAGSQADFLDASRAVYVPNGGTFVSKKLADGATCADVRAALP